MLFLEVGSARFFYCVFYRQNMSDRIIQKIEEFILPLLVDQGLELVEIQFKQEAGWFLRVFIDREEGGVNVDDCATISRQLSTFLDVEDLIQQHYTLELSSPGAERPLKKLNDFKRFVGRKVRVKLLESVQQQHVFLGLLTAVDTQGEQITLMVDGEAIPIALEAIARARLSL
jgi:ribosome maturation factor RimP